MRRHVWIAGNLFTMMLTLGAALTGMARPKGDTWEVRETPMLSQRVGFATSTVNGKIYAIGGSVQMLWTRKHVEEFDPATDTWEKKTDMLEPRSNFSSNVVEGKIFVFGGVPEAYDPIADSWEKKAPVPKRRWGYSTTVVDGKIYAIGGMKLNPEKYFGTVEVYDPATDAWEKRADMPTARCCLSVNTVNGIIYAISGGDESGILKTVEAYDPTTDTWEQLADMPEPRAGRSEVIDGKIFLFSGGVVFARSLFIYTPPFRLPRSVNPASKLATTWGQVKTGQ